MAFGFGRIGCFMAHDHPGLESDFFLAVQGVCRNHWTDINYACHDLGLYEAIWACSMIGVVYFLDKKARFWVLPCDDPDGLRSFPCIFRQSTNRRLAMLD